MNKFTTQVEVSIDPEANASYVSFKTDRQQDSTVELTIPIHDSNGYLIGAIDLDASGRTVGIELLRASKTLPRHWLEVE